MKSDPGFLYTLAILYYREGLTQQEISERLGISRPQISRALAQALAEGIVRIEIIPPKTESEMALALQKRLGIKKVIVAPRVTRADADWQERNQDIALAAANYLEEILKTTSYVGVGWGDTVYRTAVTLDYSRQTSQTCFVPLIGSLGMRESRFQVNSIVDRFAEKTKGKRLFLNTPAFVEDVQTRDKAIKDSRFSALAEVWNKLEVAIIGLGVPADNFGFPEDEFRPEQVKKLRNSQVVGDILCQFFNDEGDFCKTGNENEYLGISIDALKAVPEIICLSGGNAKIEGIIAAAKKQYFTTLITDERTAAALMKYLEDSV